MNLRDEFIGERMKVLMSRNQTLLNLDGTITDETKNTFTIDFETMVMKQNNLFDIAGLEVHGNDILLRSEDRIKRLK